MTSATVSNHSLLRVILHPLIRFCLQRAITSAELIEAVKQSLVDEALQELRKAKLAVSASRVSVMTGLDRRDVSRLLRSEKPSAPRVSWPVRIIGQWENDKRFCDAMGKPRSLSVSGPDNEFRRLAAAVSQDINSGAILLELQRVGAVVVVDGFVSLRKRVYDQHGLPEKGLNLLYRDAESLCRAVTENLSSPRKLRNLHIRSSYDNVSQEALPRIRRWFLKEGAKFQQRARAFLSQFDKDLNPEIQGECNATVSLTTFSLTDGLEAMPDD